MTRIKAVYGRQSVDKADSISIESQIEFCQHELRGGSHRTYTDKGFSGKNTDRPKFQELISDIEKGLISRVIVYKLDRISRSIIDFAKMIELFQRYKVEFVSATEKFDTSSPMGRAMLNICIVFAQLERETIQRRVTDAFYSRCQRGFHMTGKAPYGYTLEPTTIDGIKTKMMAVDPVAAEHIKLMFEMYAEPQTSFGDITRHFTERGITFKNGKMNRATISLMLRNPVYVQADLEFYEFFKSQGADIVNEAADFTGLNGCYLYKSRDAQGYKHNTLDHILVVAPHEGIVPAKTWLACRKRLMVNTNFGSTHKAKNTWLSGKIRCGVCGSSLACHVKPSAPSYFRCRRRLENKGCEGCGTLRVREIEDHIFSEMRRKMADFHILMGDNPAKANPKLTALNVSLAQVEADIEKLVESLLGANATLMVYANKKIEELDAQRQTLNKQIADITAEAVSPEHMNRIYHHLETWESVGFDDRREAVDGLISYINATENRIETEWKM
jgi:DNA invertase Pin-like site-specific DNA recombinase